MIIRKCHHIQLVLIVYKYQINVTVQEIIETVSNESDAIRIPRATTCVSSNFEQFIVPGHWDENVISEQTSKVRSWKI